MLILAADTSGKGGSLALVRFESDQPHVLELVPLQGGTFSAQMVPQIAQLLAKHGLTKTAIDAFAVVSGPGSFTGLRVGLAAIKALAEVLHKPIAAVPLLEAVARAAGREGRVLAALDAGRGELYCAQYEIQSGRARLISEKVLTQEEFAAASAGQTVATPDPRLAEIVQRTDAQVVPVMPLKADAIARLGYGQIQAGETTPPEALDAAYIRRADAEIRRPLHS
ncbi:MAG TPA: tRNA (adenosine(37)-N6)-threonylcarbamoyltransferase complex dimerization subunit type 1 TsaB [Terriglobales bacterium]|nr:tRNA (adenosine(37)-N6)-threonylcarbamoyltransferase complex dimerization subunit type 1 TsaB [Terriglobales bacterium]